MRSGSNGHRAAGRERVVAWLTGAWLRAVICAPALVTAAVLGACAAGDRARESARAGDSVESASAENPEVAAVQGAGSGSLEADPSATNDNTIFATLGSANAAEIDAGRLAHGRASAADVRVFAGDMVTEHLAMQREAEQLATRLGVVPQPLTNDTVQAKAAALQARLDSAEGAAFDRAYVGAQVSDHANMLRALQAAEPAAANPELKALIRAAIPRVQRHLERARDLQRRLDTGA